MRFIICLYCVFFSLLLQESCGKDKMQQESLHALDNFNRTIRFNVKHVYQVSPEMDSALEGAAVKIYSDYTDFRLAGTPDASRETDSTGYCEIAGLDKDKYYIRASYPGFDDVTDSVSTPDGTISFVALFFY